MDQSTRDTSASALGCDVDGGGDERAGDERSYAQAPIRTGDEGSGDERAGDERCYAQAPIRTGDEGCFEVRNPMQRIATGSSNDKVRRPPPATLMRQDGRSGPRAFSEDDVVPLKSFANVVWFVVLCQHLSRRIHANLGRVAKRFGVALCAYSVCEASVHTYLLFAGDEDSLSLLLAGYAAFPLSVAALAAHISMTLPYPRAQWLWVHLSSHAGRAAANGYHSAKMGDAIGATYSGIVWPLLFCFVGVTLRGLRNRVQDTVGPVLSSRAASVGLVGAVLGFPPLLYLSFNSAACLLFAESPRETCGSRIEVNYALTSTLVFTGFLPVLLVFEPLSLDQIMRLELPRSHLVAGAFGIVSFVCAVSLASTHERFAPATMAILNLGRLCYMSALAGLMVLGAGWVQRASALPKGVRLTSGSTSRHVSLTACELQSELRAPPRLVPWRVLLHSITLAHLATCHIPALNSSLAIPSVTSAVFHFFLTTDTAITWPLIHYVCHSTGAVLNARDPARALMMLVFVLIVYPPLLKGTLMLRRAVRERGDDASACAQRDVFRVLWTFLLPAIVMLSADTVGCFISPPDDDVAKCGNRDSANYITQLHLTSSAFFALIFSSDEWGLATTEATCLLLEFSRPVKAAITLVALASTVTLHLISKRDVEREASFWMTSQISAVIVLWVSVWVLTGRNFSRILDHREEQKRTARTTSTCAKGHETSSHQRAVTVHLVYAKALPGVWSFFFVSVSWIVFTFPRIWQCLSHTGSVQGTVLHATCGGSFSFFLIVCHCMMFAGADILWPRHLHFVTQLLGIIAGWGYEIYFSSLVEVAVLLLVWIGFVRGRQRLNIRTDLTTRSFRWLLRGGMATALYLYFETLACALDPGELSFEAKMCEGDSTCDSFGLNSCTPLWYSNAMSLDNAMSYAVFVLVFLADCRCTTKQILRGRAPQHILAASPFILLCTLLAVFVFAGREFTGAAQTELYAALYGYFVASAIVGTTVMFVGHLCWREQTRTGKHAEEITSTDGQLGWEVDGATAAV